VKRRYYVKFVAYITVNGKVLWARDYGYKAWPIRIYY